MHITVTAWMAIWQTLAVAVGAAAVWLVVRVSIRHWAPGARRKMEARGTLEDRARAQRFDTIAGTLTMVAFIVITVVAVVMVLAVWGVPIGPIVASLSVVGFAVGFGAQSLIKDVIAGMFVLIENQYALGDVIEIAGVTGTVQELRLRTTVLRGLDGSVYHVPNGEIKVTRNLTHDFSRLVVDVAVAYEEPVDRAIEVIADEASRLAADPAWSGSLVEETKVLGVDELADSGVVIRVLLTTDPEERWAVKREFLRRIKNRFDEEGIEIPYPHLTIDRRSEPG
jgi:small conductance mechanosensitive channel